MHDESVVGERIAVEQFPLASLDDQQLTLIARSVAGGSDNIEDIYPLAPLQAGMLFHYLLNEGSDTYVMSILFELRSCAAVETLISALQRVIDRHVVLRTALVWEGLPQPMQVVHRRVTLPIQQSVLNPCDPPLQQLKEWMQPGYQHLDPRSAPMLRLQITPAAANDDWYAVLRIHHLMCDHRSLELVLAETLACAESREQELPAPVPFKMYVRQSLERSSVDDADAFFRRKLGQVEEPTTPFGLTHVRREDGRIEEASRLLDVDLARRIRSLARRASPATFFHAAWALVVAHAAARDEVVFGTVMMSGLRGTVRNQRLLGNTVNTLPLRLRIADLTARELVVQTHDELVDLAAHDQASLAIAQRCSGITDARPLFTALINYRRSAPEQRKSSEAAGIRVLARGEAWSSYPIAVTVDDLGEGFKLTSHADDRVGPERVLDYLQTALASLADALESAPQTSALALPVVPERERDLLLRRFNATAAAFLHDRTIHNLFEQQALRTPSTPAVICGTDSLTFAELNGRANQLARHLRRHGVGPDKLVALCMERSIQMVVGVLGTLKAGGAYVPLDPSYPAEMLCSMLQDAAPVVALVQEHLRRSLPTDAGKVIEIDAQWSVLDEESAADLDSFDVGVAAHHLAYVIFTSGSTGRPKGVMIEHRNLASLWQGLEDIYRRCRPCRRVAVNASFTFDASVKQLVQLLSGRTLVLVPQEARWDAQQLLDLLDLQRIDAIDCTPWQLKAWLAAGLLAPDRYRPAVILVGGEAIEQELWRVLAAADSQTAFCNVYGPTESTVDVTFALINGDQEAPHIGPPMQNRRVYIVDRGGQPVPIGVIGEMWIGGAGVARGYLHRPELTAERFARDPFDPGAQSRLYRSGDLARWRANGRIEYIGRNDHQVKVRGFRIETGEIESQIMRHAGVDQAAVIVREDVLGERLLVAYVVVSDLTSAPRADALRAQLRVQLPDHMIPSAFVVLDRMPLTANGKLDRRALPAPQLDAYATRQYDAPQGEVEEMLVGIWQTLLRVERVGRHDNFFELGGHSLLIMQMMERLRGFGLSAEVRRVFDSPTLAALATAISTDGVSDSAPPPNLIPDECQAITPQMLTLVNLRPDHIAAIVRRVPDGASNVQDIYPLTPLQEGILFHHMRSERGTDVYVAPTVLAVASRERLDELIRALQQVIEHYELLRTAVLWEGLPRPVQVVYRRAQLPVEEVELATDNDALEQVRDWARPDRQQLDIRQAPPMRVRIAADPLNGRWYVLLQLHHIVADATSLRALIAEIVARLEHRPQRRAVAVPYRNHVAHALAHALQSDAETFFRGKLASMDEPTAPYGLRDVHGDGSQIEEVSGELGDELARRLRAQARRLGVSVATVFHAAWALVVARTSGRDDVVFGTVLLGRLHASARGEPVLGMFINTLPLRLRLQDLTARGLVEQTQRELIDLLAHEQSSLATALRCSGVEASTPLFTTLINFRHGSVSTDCRWSDASGIEVLASHGYTNYPITFSIDDLGGRFGLSVQTDRRIAAHRVEGYVRTALHSLVEALEQSTQAHSLALEVLPAAERHELIELLNATNTDFGRVQLAHELFEAQAVRTPDAVAVVHVDESLSYSQLNAKANQIARFLRERGVGRGQLVGVCVERSLSMVVSVLGILKAGGAYLPLDPNFPRERLQHMLEDASPCIVLTQPSTKAILPPTQAALVDLHADWSAIAAHAADNLAVGIVDRDIQSLVYVIYTSGSTGRPKGTAMPHRAVVNLIQWHRRTLPCEVGEPVLQFAALSFDVAFQEIFSTLCDGGRLVLLDEWMRRDVKALVQLLNREAVARLFVPPLMLQGLAEYCAASGILPLTLRALFAAGEQLLITDEIVALLTQLRGCRLHNHYGPTETHVVTTLTLPEDARQWAALPTIGRPLANTRIYILDRDLRPAPFGIAGEIYIGGANVANGYVNRPELTAERFLQDPFSRDTQARMYKTGDLGRWCTEGTIEYLGRNDNQVKIRGFRIELGEIEAQLARHPRVREAAVVARDDGSRHKRLVAYLTPRGPDAVDVEELRTYLVAALPEYMVPVAFVILERLPLTPTGKLDRRALPAPDSTAYVSMQYEAPYGEVEEGVARICEQVLRAERIGRRANFFELGGHSLLAMQVIARIQALFSVDVPIRALFDYPTIKDFAEQVDSIRQEALLTKIREGGDRMAELLEEVSQMPEERVRGLLKELNRGTRQ